MKVKMKNETNPLERRTWRSDSPARLFQWFFRIFSSDPASISDGYFTASLLSVPRISPCQVKTPFYPFLLNLKWFKYSRTCFMALSNNSAEVFRKIMLSSLTSLRFSNKNEFLGEIKQSSFREQIKVCTFRVRITVSIFHLGISESSL